jgi:hypothetical protein
MTSEEFVTRIRKAVYEPAVEGSLSLLRKPPGRRPSQALLGLSKWFNGLSTDDRLCVRRLIELSAGRAVFGMLAVLDGVRSIREAGEESGTLELHYCTEGRLVLLNDPAGEFLHDLFAEQVPPA